MYVDTIILKAEPVHDANEKTNIIITSTGDTGDSSIRKQKDRNSSRRSLQAR